MKNLVPLLLVLACTPAFAQTKLVSHRSHGGSLETFSSKEEGNFGEYIHHRKLKKVVKLSDTTAIEVYNVERDTTLNHPYWNNPRIRVDSLRKLFPDISFEGYETSDVVAEAEPESLPLVLLSAGMSVVVAGSILRRRRA